MPLQQIDPNELQAQADDVNNSKMWLNVANSAANNLLSAPSAAGISAGLAPQKVNVGLDKVADSIQDPWERQKKVYENYINAKNADLKDSDLKTAGLTQDKLKMANEMEAQKNDPNSQKSIAAKNAYGGFLVKSGMAQADVDAMSANDVEDVMSGKIKIEDMRGKAADRALKTQLIAQNHAAKVEKDEADAYKNASHDMNTYRGNQAAQQAATALTNAKNALALANKGKLSPDQLHLFASEMGKLATGGVPGHAEIAALIPNTLQSNIAKFSSFFKNSPSDAQAQDFIDNNKEYLNELISNYSGVLNKYKQDALDGYKYKIKDKAKLAELQSKISQPTEPAHEQSVGAGGGEPYVVGRQTSDQGRTRVLYSDGTVKIFPSVAGSK